MTNLHFHLQLVLTSNENNEVFLSNYLTVVLKYAVTKQYVSNVIGKIIYLLHNNLIRLGYNINSVKKNLLYRTFQQLKIWLRLLTEMVAKEEDLISAKIPPQYRDYCSHRLLDYQVCRYKNMPLLYKCAHEKHHYLQCEQQEWVSC